MSNLKGEWFGVLEIAEARVSRLHYQLKHREKNLQMAHVLVNVTFEEFEKMLHSKISKNGKRDFPQQVHCEKNMAQKGFGFSARLTTPITS